MFRREILVSPRGCRAFYGDLIAALNEPDAGLRPLLEKHVGKLPLPPLPNSAA